MTYTIEQLKQWQNLPRGIPEIARVAQAAIPELIAEVERLQSGMREIMHNFAEAQTDCRDSEVKLMRAQRENDAANKTICRLSDQIRRLEMAARIKMAQESGAEIERLKSTTDLREFVILLLEARIRKILEISHREPEPHDCAESICFHLMEIRFILEGKATCGVFDDYGPTANERAGEPRGKAFGDNEKEK